jgi:hypothetical protein
MPGLGGAEDRAHPAESSLTLQPARELGDETREALVQRRLRGRQVLDVGGTRVAGADQGEDPGPRLGRGGDERLERVAPQQRVGGEGVGAEPGDGAPGGRRLSDQGLRVGGRGDRDVAALAVGDDQQARFLSSGADLFQGAPAGRAEALEAGELRLDGDAGRSRLVDQAAAVGGDRGGRQLCGRGAGIAWRLPLPGQLGRVGVEAEADLAAALFDERRQPIGERVTQWISRP